MDLQTFGIIFIVIVFSLLSILFVSKLPAGKTFDEMLAEKKQLAAKLDSLSSGKNEKNGQKKGNKKGSRKNKNVVHTHKHKESEPESVESAGSDSNSDNDMEFYQTDAFSLSANAKKNKNITNVKKNKVSKPVGILVNKSEPVLVKDALVIEEVNHFVEIHPKDAIEIHRTVQKEDVTDNTKSKTIVKDAKKLKAHKITLENKPHQPEIVKAAINDNLIKSVEITEVAAAITSSPVKNNEAFENLVINKDNKNLKKKKDVIKPKKPEVFVDDELNVKFLIRTINNTALTHTEIQLLIDFLLNKQQDTITKDPSEWSEGRSDVVQKMKKQLLEREQQLKDEQDAIQALQLKLKSLRTEINTEKSQYNAHIKQYIDDINNKNIEIERLSVDSNILKEKLGIEKNLSITSIQQLQQELAGKNQIISDLKLLVDESNRYNDEKQLDIDNVLRKKDEQKNLIELELRQRLQELSSSENEKQKLRADLKMCEDELNRHKFDVDQFKMQMEQLKLQLTKAAANNHIDDSNKVDIRNLQNALDSKVTELKSLRDEIIEYKQLNESLNIQIINYKQQINNSIIQNNEYSKEVSELKSIISNQKSNMLNCETKLKELDEQIRESTSKEEILRREIEEQKIKNNDLRKKNWKLIEALQVAQNSNSNKNVLSNSNVSEGNIKNIIEEEQKRTKELLTHSLLDTLELKDDDIPSEYNKWMEYTLHYIKKQLNSNNTSNQHVNNKSKALINNNINLIDNQINNLNDDVVANHQNHHNNSNSNFHQNDNDKNVVNNNVNNEDGKSNSDNDLLYENAQLKSDVNNLKKIIADIEKLLHDVEAKAREQENEIKSLKSATAS